MTPDPTIRIGWPAVEVVSPLAMGAVVLVCEHAASFVPPSVRLGLDPADALSHAAWDPGAGLVARRMAARLDAPLVAGTVSRLVYDLNRPPDSPEAMRDRSERVAVPGNRDLPEADRRARVAELHDPFHAALADVLARRPGAALVTVHSFTPVFEGRSRTVELGFLHDRDASLARAMLAAAPEGFASALNEPYASSDGVTYTVRRHGSGRAAAMIEIRNDLIAEDATCEAMGDALAETVRAALAAAAGQGGRVA